jgi:VWFA-related protein
MTTHLAPLFRATLVACLLAAAPLAAAGQSAPQTERVTPPAGTFSGSTEVEVVEVPVQVIRDGAPVRGLNVSDFEVWAGKQKQRIVGFEAIDVEALQEAGAPVVSQLPASARRHFLFLFDLSQSTPTSLGRAQRAALQLVDRLSLADLAGVALYSPARGPRVLLGFTSDRAQVKLALSTFGSSEMVEARPDWLGLTLGQAKVDMSEAEMSNPRGERVGGGDTREDPINAREAALERYLDTLKDMANAEDRAIAASERDRARTFARGLSDLGTMLEGVAGRKHVLLLSEGFASRLLTGTAGVEPPRREEDGTESVAQIYRTDSEVRFGSGRLQSELRRLAEAMKRADCVVHSIDIAGLQTEGRSISGEVGAVRDQGVQHAGAGDDSLFYLAKETGGTFFRNYNDLAGAMSGVLHATSVTYVLSIQPGPVETRDGYVPLRVEVRDAGRGEVSARPGYFALRPQGAQQALRERLRIAGEVLEGHAGGALRSAALGVPLPGGEGKVCAIVEVDGESLLEGHVGDMVSAEVSVYAFDRQGTIQATARQLVGLDLRVVGERLRGAGFKLFAGLDLPPGEYDLRALVRNTVSGRYGIATARLAVPALGVGEQLAGVFVEPPGRNWLLVRETSSGSPLAYPFTVGERVVVPAVAPRFRGGEAVTLWVEAPAGAVTLEAVVKRADGGVAASPALELGERTPGEPSERLLASFSPAGLAPGAYTLEVRVPGAAGATSSGLPFVVE